MKLKELRLNSNLSQKELADVAKVSQKTISNYENGENNQSIEALAKLANYLGVSLDYLCERPFNNNIGYIPEDKKDLIIKIIALNDRQIQRVDDFISGMQDK